MPDWIEDPSAPGFEESAPLRYQRHALQVGAADRALGQLLDHLQDHGWWDDTVAGVTGRYKPADDRCWFNSILGPYLVQGNAGPGPIVDRLGSISPPTREHPED